MKKLASCLRDLYPNKDSWDTPETRPKTHELSNTWKPGPATEEFIRLPISITATSMIDRLNFDLKHLNLDGRNKPTIPFLNQKGGEDCSQLGS